MIIWVLLIVLFTTDGKVASSSVVAHSKEECLEARDQINGELSKQKDIAGAALGCLAVQVGRDTKA